jgi:hypothetical protein
MLYNIPFSYTVNSIIPINAKDLNDANSKAIDLLNRMEIHELRSVCSQITAVKNSFRINQKKAKELNPKQKYKVRVYKSNYVDIEVEAHSIEDAEDVAKSEAREGSIEFSGSDDDFITELKGIVK